MLSLVLAVALSDSAFAQAMTFDPVFVSRFVGETEADDKFGERIRSLLEQRLGNEFVMIARDEVPAFEDYTSEVYLGSCPRDEFFGCAFVIGGRAQAEWVVAGQTRDGSQVSVVFIDVADSRMVFSFDATVTSANEMAFADGVATLMHRLVEGAGEERDIRGAIEDPEEKARREKLQREALAASLAELEDDLGAMERAVELGEIETPRLTKDDLARKYAGSDEAKPWERLGMGESEYLRYQNSGEDVKTWRRMRQGRLARVIVSGMVGPTSGPFSQEFDGRWALNGTTLDVAEVEAFQEVENSSGFAGGIEVAAGVHPWFDVGIGMLWRTGTYTYLFHQEVEGQVPPDPDPTYVDPARTHGLNTTQWVGRVRFAPMATYRYRPIASVGIGAWKGTSVERIVELPPYLAPLGAPAGTLLELGAGGELDLSPMITVFATGQAQVLLAGDFLQEYQQGSPTLVNRGTPDGRPGGGAEFLIGARARLGPLFELKAQGPKSYDEDEDIEEEP